jgi:hypothetical protein
VITSITPVGNTSKQIAQNPQKNLTVRGFDEKAFAAFVRTLFREDWVVYASSRSVDQSTSCTTWLATRIAWRFPTIGCST